MTTNEQSLLTDLSESLDAQAPIVVKYITDIVNADVADKTVAAKVIADVTAKINAFFPALKAAFVVEFKETDTNDDLTKDLLA